MSDEQETPQKPAKRRQVRKISAQSLNNIALHYLQRYASSAENLRRVLMRRVIRAAKHHDSDPADGERLVDALIQRFRSNGLLDDQRYAEGRAVSLRRRGTSQRLIAQGLRQKGIGDDDIAAALAQINADRDDDEDIEFVTACRLAQRRRLGPFRAAEKRPQHQQRDLATLARAGFAYDIARRVISHEDCDELTDLIAKAGL
ncbi:MAG: regulator [Nisaea sp.]|jgi:regulatory protein|nr:regulator [Nisaea sp.]OUY00028.1 MAG: hypothetical protein CBB86_01195 [Candidatus Endolissoclinum sp. TMED26]|tara:strand:- start:336 stop:941 length:606 start_codon:yes stop_codon:yes gene_type:complete